jgi:hypothetical protein
MERFSHSREEIYEAVWSAPMRDACKRFGVTDVALGKVCKRLNVPRPKQGYWQRRAIGQTPPTVPLPTVIPGAPTRWEGERSIEPKRVVATPTETPPVSVEPIPVPDVIEDLHPALKAVIPDMRRVSKDLWGFHRWNGTIPVLASEAMLDRALRIMNALLHALEARGHRFEVTPHSAPGEPWRMGGSGVWVGDVFVGLSLYERTKRARDEIELRGARRQDSWRPTRYVPSGFLSIRVHGSYTPYREWTDTKTAKIESRLHEVIPAVLARAEEIRAEWIEAERRREADRQAQIRRAEAERLRREEEEKVARLRETLARWREVRDVRAFIAEARAIVAAGGHEIEAGSTLDQFIRWATARVERIDPFSVMWRDASEPPEARSAAASS